jgi:hypothetical protein
MYFKASLIELLSCGVAGATALIGIAARAEANSFTQGNLVVVRIGDGLQSLSSASTALFLDEYTPSGTFVQTIALPTAASGTNNPITDSGVATSDGFLTLSINGQYLVQAGYSVAPGIPSVVSTTSATAPRVVARIDLYGNVDTSTLLNGDTSYSGNNIRSATSNDGNQFWTSGTATAVADGGVRYVASLGANTATQISSTVTNTRVIGSFANQLYVSSSSGSFKGVNTVGTGLPTTSGQTITLLPGFPSATPSQYDYFFADANTLYVAEDGSSGALAGIQKWTFSGGTWTLQYTLSPAGTGVRGLTGEVSGGVATLYATTSNTASNSIVTLTDTGSGSTFSTVATAATNEVFRGIRRITMNASPGIDVCRPGIDFTTPTCPCNNNAPTTPGAGCNGLSPGGVPTGGAKLSAAGTASLTGTNPGTDTLQLTVVGLPTTASESCFLIQGPTLGAPLTFGQGLRCVTGSLKRLQIHSASPGTSTWPAATDFSPTIQARSAALGVTILAGQTFYYFVEYRQSLFIAPCVLPANFNASNAEAVTWTP